MHWHILFEDNHLIAVFKPAGMLTQPDPGGDPDLFSLVREDLAIRHQKKGEAFMGVVHRIDRPVSGLVLFAKTSKALERMNNCFGKGWFVRPTWPWFGTKSTGKPGPSSIFSKRTTKKTECRPTITKFGTPKKRFWTILC